MPTVIINSESDNVVPLLAQLKHAVETESTLSSKNGKIIKILNAKGFIQTSHEAVLRSNELNNELNGLILSRVDKTASRKTYQFN